MDLCCPFAFSPEAALLYSDFWGFAVSHGRSAEAGVLSWDDLFGGDGGALIPGLGDGTADIMDQDGEKRRLSCRSPTMLHSITSSSDDIIGCECTTPAHSSCPDTLVVTSFTITNTGQVQTIHLIH